MDRTFTHNLRPWKVLGRDMLLSASPWLNVYRERVELPTGRVIDDFYRVVTPDFIVVVPVTSAGEVVMIRGYKHGLGRVTLSPPRRPHWAGGGAACRRPAGVGGGNRLPR